MPIEFIEAVLASNNTRLGAAIVVIYTLARIAEKLATGWVNNRTQDADHQRADDEKWHQYAQKLQKQIEQRTEDTLKDLKLRLANAEKEADHWRVEANKWHDKYLLAVAVSEQQRTTIEELTAKVDQLTARVQTLTKGGNQ